MANLKHMNNDMAVSPIVATLVLIVVAVIGAVAVGTIMGTFSTDVSKKTNTGDISGASSTEILVAGSTTVQPASELIAKAYMTSNPSIKINVQGGGSGAGVSSVGLGIVDIGASSDLGKITDAINSGKVEYKDLKYTQIGGSGVVVISGNSTVQTTGVTTAELLAAYNGVNPTTYKTTTSLGGVASGLTLYTRGDSSGTKDTFSEFITTSTNKTATDLAKPITGNELLASTVKTDANGVGFTDYGIAYTLGVPMVNINSLTPTSANILDALKTGGSTKYPVGMTRGLYYITNGEPSPMVKNYITFAASPGAIQYFNKAGMFGVGEFYATK